MPGPEEPFVLLDDASDGSAGARLFSGIGEIVEARSLAEVEPALDRLAERLADGATLAGFFGYEAGFALETKLAPLGSGPAQENPPLLWFGTFEREQHLDDRALVAMLGDPEGAWAGKPEPDIASGDYLAGVERLLEHIHAGDIYQANYTFPCDVPIVGDPLALYARLRKAARAGHGAIVWTGHHWLLSLSPELFFTLEDGLITARPMKGTAARANDPAEDAAAAEALAASEKDRAENLMITDLLRNDLSRVAADGSVAVPKLFAVETYPTVHQMTSTVVARLAEGNIAIDILRAIYPCGSITGAPKIRAMQILHDLERGPRGPYTGSIGSMGPEGKADFNVAIRTLVLAEGADRARLGLGAGIVADSDPAAEWRECLAKGAFVTRDQPTFDLIETVRFEPDLGIRLLDRHLTRLRESARVFGFEFDHHAARNALQAASFHLRAPARIRLRLARGGHLAIETRPAPEPPAEPVVVAIARRDASAADYRLRHKTSRREIYEEAMVEGVFETLLEDNEGFLTEGCFTNLFVERDGLLLTPPASRGLLPGVLRAELLASGKARETDLTRADLAGGFLIGNALRGLIRAKLA